MKELFANPKRLYFYLSLIYLPPLALLAAAVVISLYTHIPVGDFTRDPSSIVELHSYEGIISNLGALVWCATTTVCLFAALLLLSQDRRSQMGQFLLLAGFTTGVLLVDDFFLLHEKLNALGISEHLAALCYVVPVIIMLLRYRSQLQQGKLLIFLSALALLALSAGVDTVEHPLEQWIGEWRVLFEDGFKFLGLVGWFGYFAPTCFVAVTRQLTAKEALKQPSSFFSFEGNSRLDRHQHVAG